MTGLHCAVRDIRLAPPRDKFARSSGVRAVGLIRLEYWPSPDAKPLIVEFPITVFLDHRGCIQFRIRNDAAGINQYFKNLIMQLLMYEADALKSVLGPDVKFYPKQIDRVIKQGAELHRVETNSSEKLYVHL